MATGSELPLHSTFIRAILLPPETFPRPRQDVNDSLFVLRPWCNAIRVRTPPEVHCCSRCHRGNYTLFCITTRKRKWPHDGHSKTISSSTSREVGRHIKVQWSSNRLNVVLLIIMIMFFRAFIWWAITYFTWNFYWIRLFMRGACLNTVILLEKYIVPTKISAGRARWPELRDQQLNWTNRQ